MFVGLKNCISLDLQNNQISEIESGTFNSLNNLEILYLSGNRLTALKAIMFYGLVALESLSLWRNNIDSIEDNTFVNLYNLERLSLDDSRLKSLSPGLFCGLFSLNRLDLGGNNPTTLPTDVFNYVPRPLELGLSDPLDEQTPDNPLQCDLSLCWLK